MGTGYTRQSAGAIITGETIEASDLNAEYNQLESAFNASTGHSHDGTTGEGPLISLTGSITGTLAVANGGTNATTASAARTSLGLAIGTDVQAYDAGLQSISGLTTAADKMIYTTALDTYAVTDLSSFARTILDDTSASAVRTTIGVVIGTNVQAYDSDLAALAANSSNGLWARTGAGTGSARTITGPAAGISVADGDGVSGNPTLSLANDLGALEALSSTGIAVRTNSDTWAQRTITGTSNEITVSNGDGVSGNPTISLPNALTFTGKTITGGTLSGITDLAIADGGTGSSTAADARTALAVPGIGTTNAFTERQTWSMGTTIDDDDVDGSNILTLPTDGNVFIFSGTQQVDAIATIGGAGPIYLIHTSARTLTHHATNLILPGEASITTASGDVSVWVEYATADWRCVSYLRTAIGVGATSSTDHAIPRFDGTAGKLQNSTATIDDSGNVTINGTLTVTG